MENTITALQEIGLSHNEAVIYLHALQLGPASIMQLSQHSGIKRTTVYNIVDVLMEKGLFYVQHQGSKKLFMAQEPKQLTHMIERKHATLNSLLPILEEYQTKRVPKKNVIKSYDGLEGMRTVYNLLLDDLSTGDDYFIISDETKWYSLDPDFFDHFMKKREALKLSVKHLVIGEVSDISNTYTKQIQTLPAHFNLNVAMLMTKHKIVLVEHTAPVSVTVIEHPAFIAMQQSLFLSLWQAN